MKSIGVLILISFAQQLIPIPKDGGTFLPCVINGAYQWCVLQGAISNGSLSNGYTVISIPSGGAGTVGPKGDPGPIGPQGPPGPKGDVGNLQVTVTANFRITGPTIIHPNADGTYTLGNNPTIGNVINVVNRTTRVPLLVGEYATNGNVLTLTTATSTDLDVTWVSVG